MTDVLTLNLKLCIWSHSRLWWGETVVGHRASPFLADKIRCRRVFATAHVMARRGHTRRAVSIKNRTSVPRT